MSENVSFIKGGMFYGLHLSQLIRLARTSTHFSKLNDCHKLLTTKILK